MSDKRGWSPVDELPSVVAESLVDHGPRPHLTDARAVVDLLGTIAATLSPTPAPTPGLRDRLLRAVAAPDQRFAPFWARLNEMFDISEAETRAVLVRAQQEAEWELGFLPGTDLLHFAAGPAWRGRRVDAGLVRVAAGSAFPEHIHLGDELVLILAGDYLDSDGTRYRAGDRHFMPAGSRHHYQAGADGVLFAVLLDEGIELPGLGTHRAGRQLP